jgi:aminoglycoside phosphotransferase (APT) family kinase protein
MRDVRLDETQAAHVIASQFEALAPARVAYLGEGCDSCAFDVNGEWVFRFPKRADVEAQLAIEARMLPRLAERSPLPVPVFSFLGCPSAAYPYRFAGYRKLPGVPGFGLDASEAGVIATIAGFLSWLHGFPAREAEAQGVPPRDAGDLFDELRTDVLDDLPRLAGVIAHAPLDEWRAFFERGCAAPGATAPVLVHGDLAAEHILHDPARRRITGVIDWSELALGDAAIDLAAFYHWGGRPCFEAALSVYGHPIDGRAAERARFLAACRGVGDVVFGLDRHRPEYIDAGRRALALSLDVP